MSAPSGRKGQVFRDLKKRILEAWQSWKSGDDTTHEGAVANLRRFMGHRDDGGGAVLKDICKTILGTEHRNLTHHARIDMLCREFGGAAGKKCVALDAAKWAKKGGTKHYAKLRKTTEAARKAVDDSVTEVRAILTRRLALMSRIGRKEPTPKEQSDIRDMVRDMKKWLEVNKKKTEEYNSAKAAESEMHALCISHTGKLEMDLRVSDELRTMEAKRADDAEARADGAEAREEALKLELAQSNEQLRSIKKNLSSEKKETKRLGKEVANLKKLLAASRKKEGVPADEHNAVKEQLVEAKEQCVEAEAVAKQAEATAKEAEEARIAANKVLEATEALYQSSVTAKLASHTHIELFAACIAKNHLPPPLEVVRWFQAGQLGPALAPMPMPAAGAAAAAAVPPAKRVRKDGEIGMNNEKGVDNKEGEGCDKFQDDEEPPAPLEPITDDADHMWVRAMMVL